MFLLTIKFYNKHKSNYNLLVLLVSPDLEIIEIWVVSYMCQDGKSHFLFWIFPNVWAMFIFE